MSTIRGTKYKPLRLQVHEHAPSPYPGFRGCLIINSDRILWGIHASIMVVDAVAFAFMAISAHQAYRPGNICKFSFIVYRDGILFYIFLLSWGISAAKVATVITLPSIFILCIENLYPVDVWLPVVWLDPFVNSLAIHTAFRVDCSHCPQHSRHADGIAYGPHRSGTPNCHASPRCMQWAPCTVRSILSAEVNVGVLNVCCVPILRWIFTVLELQLVDWAKQTGVPSSEAM